MKTSLLCKNGDIFNRIYRVLISVMKSKIFEFSGFDLFNLVAGHSWTYSRGLIPYRNKTQIQLRVECGPPIWRFIVQCSIYCTIGKQIIYQDYCSFWMMISLR